MKSFELRKTVTRLCFNFIGIFVLLLAAIGAINATDPATKPDAKEILKNVQQTSSNINTSHTKISYSINVDAKKSFNYLYEIRINTVVDYSKNPKRYFAQIGLIETENGFTKRMKSNAFEEYADETAAYSRSTIQQDTTWKLYPDSYEILNPAETLNPMIASAKNLKLASNKSFYCITADIPFTDANGNPIPLIENILDVTNSSMDVSFLKEKTFGAKFWIEKKSSNLRKVQIYWGHFLAYQYEKSFRQQVFTLRMDDINVSVSPLTYEINQINFENNIIKPDGIQ